MVAHVSHRGGNVQACLLRPPDLPSRVEGLDYPQLLSSTNDLIGVCYPGLEFGV